jgi:hypothetical protein
VKGLEKYVKDSQIILKYSLNFFKNFENYLEFAW